MYNTGMKDRRVLNRLYLAWIIIILTLGVLPWGTAQAQEATPKALVLTANGPLTPAMAEYLSRGIDTAEKENAELVILQLNTPGGDIVLMGEIVGIIRGSFVPVVVFVTPRGAMAGSAGTLITLAGHLAAMSPQTTIGAASPVGGGGEDIGETMEAKLKEATKAQIRTLAEGRPPEAIAMAEETVENAKALTSQEAFDIGLIDFIATDVPDLLRQLDGWKVETADGPHTLDTKFVQTEYVEARLIEELLTILIELGSPGGWVAGFIGVVCLSLAAYGLGVLPVNWFGLVFLLTAFVLFFLDIKAPTHGALTAAGVASFIVGALTLFNSSSTPSFFRVNVPLVVAMSLITAATFFTALTFALRAQRTPVRMGQASLVGQSGRVREAIPRHGQGKVHLAGEVWTAELAEGEKPLKEGDWVEVVAVDGVRLKVKKTPKL